MGGLRWWSQAHWMREQRRQWREHDARLATVWQAKIGAKAGIGSDSDIDDEPDRVIVLPDVIVLPQSDVRVSTPSR